MQCINYSYLGGYLFNLLTTYTIACDYKDTGYNDNSDIVTFSYGTKSLLNKSLYNDKKVGYCDKSIDLYLRSLFSENKNNGQ